MEFADLFRIKSPAQLKKERREFSQKVLPFGEEQKPYVVSLLRQVVETELRDEELLFAFMTAKERYIDDEKGREGIQQAAEVLKNQLWLSQQDRIHIIATVILDSETVSLQDYPTAKQVREQASKLAEM